MNSILIRVIASVWLFEAFCLMPAAWAQGPLTPPGAPAATMKTLTQVEPRIPISSAPYTISQPGSYYLTTNLTCTGHGVIITSSRVTLDLMGFALAGDRGSSDYGVLLAGATNKPISHVVVRNGITCNFGYGVCAEYIQNCRFEHLVAASNSFYGINFGGYNGSCNGNAVVDCMVNGNVSNGIYLYGSLGRCNGNTIANCMFSGNRGYGIRLRGDYGQCNGNTITGCAISGSVFEGVLLDGSYGQCNGNTITRTTISSNGSCGIWLYGYYGQCDGNAVTDCTISDNFYKGVYLYGAYGQCDGNTFRACTITGNGADGGFYLSGSSGQCDGNTIADCMIQKNTTHGIYLYVADGNRVEGNHVSGQTGNMTYGIYCNTTAKNLILRNTCVGQTNNFTIGANDTYGPIVTGSGALSTTNGAAGLSPWANFSR